MAEETKTETLAALRDALASLEAGGDPAPFTDGHGLQSRVFAFSWSEPGLSIDMRLPWSRVLSGEERRAADAAAIGSAIRMAILLVETCGRDDSGETLFVSCREDSEFYMCIDAEGEITDSGDDWSGLARRVERALPSTENEMTIIIP